MNAGRRPFTITQLRRDAVDGFWRARVTLGGHAVDVDRAAGSWLANVRRAPGARTFDRRDVLPDVAAALQAKVRPLERGAKVAR